MEFKKIINSLDDTKNQPPKFRTRNWVKINDESQGAYNEENNNNDNNDDDDNNNNNIKLKTSMTRSNLYDNSDAYILVKETITVPNTTGDSPAGNNANKKVIIKKSAPFTSCITEINNIQVDDVLDVDIIMTM